MSTEGEKSFEAEVRKIKAGYVKDPDSDIKGLATRYYSVLVETKVTSPGTTIVHFPGFLMYTCQVLANHYVVRNEYSDKASMTKIADELNTQAAGGAKCAVAGLYSVLGLEFSFGKKRITCEFTE